MTEKTSEIVAELLALREQATEEPAFTDPAAEYERLRALSSLQLAILELMRAVDLEHAALIELMGPDSQ